MQKIFYQNVQRNAPPSSRMFFCEQIPLMISIGLFERTKNILIADIIFSTVDDLKKILKMLGKKKTPIIIYKPHLEIDTYLYGKNLLFFIKALFNRILSLAGNKSFLFISNAKNIYYVADNKRIWRALRNLGKKSFHLKLIPYPVYYLRDLNYKQEPSENRVIKIGCIGEASIHNNLFRNFDFQYWKDINVKIEFIVSLYGPSANFLLKRLSQKCRVKHIDWPKNQSQLHNLFSSVDFFLVPQAHYFGNYGFEIKNLFNFEVNQPNNYISASKFSCNGGRNYLAAGLNRIFVTQPTEEVLSEFSNYPHELFYEDYKDLNAAILATLDFDIKNKALVSISTFREREYVRKINLHEFSKWCGVLVNVI
jgi:hypothetical protein